MNEYLRVLHMTKCENNIYGNKNKNRLVYAKVGMSNTEDRIKEENRQFIVMNLQTPKSKWVLFVITY